MMRTAALRGDAVAMRVMRNNKEYVWTWGEYYNDIVCFAKSLIALGIDERKAVNIMGFNSPEWAIAYFGAVFHNNVISGVYITNGPAAC
jgi:long-chain-fatty-acid--CoA ligase ACSBG